MLQLRMMTHMHHIQNIKHLMYPKYPNEKYFNKVQVQYLSKCTEPPSVCGPAHVLVTGQCNSYCRTGEDQRGQLPSASSCKLLVENSGEELSGPAASCSASFLGANVFIYGKKNSKPTRDSRV